MVIDPKLSFKKKKQTLIFTNYKSIQQVCLRKNYKTSKHLNKMQYYKYMHKKINILKLCSIFF